MRRFALTAAAVLLSPLALAADNWPEFRGPTQQGFSDSTGLPAEWSESKNIVWKTPVHGLGWSSPVVWGDQVWMTTATEDGKQMSVICLDRETGKVLLDRVVFENESPSPLGNDLNCYASPSPVIEAGRVYIHFGSYGTAAIDTATFDELWRRRDLKCDHWRGPASSPVLHGDLLILTFDGADFQYTAALDKATGKNRWLTGRSTDFDDLDPDGRAVAEGDWRKSYSTPVFVEIAGRTHMVSPGAKAFFSYDPATGAELWSLHQRIGHSSSSRILWDGELLYMNTGYGRPQLWAVRPGENPTGELSESTIVWQYSRNVPAKPSPVLVDGLIYMISDTGIATCLDARTGEEVWRERIGGEFSASILHADGRIYLFSQEGKATVIKPGRTFERIAENDLDEGFMASPAVSGKALFLRTRTHVYRVEAQ